MSLSDGWAAIVSDGHGGWRRVTPWENRHFLALVDGRDTDGDATHVGYFNGAEWEDVEPINPSA